MSISTIKRLLPSSVKKLLRSILPKTTLIKQLPLTMPLVMHIDPCNICNFKCVFCPTGDSELLATVNRPRALMNMELFSKIVNDLIYIKQKYHTHPHQIHLYKDGEPFLNKDIFKMIHLIKSKDVANVISTTTNGSLLSKQYVEDLVKSGLDLIRISVEHVNSEGYKKITSTFSDYEQIVANVRNLYDAKKRSASNLYIQVKITNSGMSKQQIENFYNEFKSISDEVRVDTLMGWSLSEKKDFTLGNQTVTGMDGISELKNRLICPEPFSKLAINSDGKVSVCCVDWSHGAIVGDVRTHSLDEIWNGELFNHIRVSHIRGERSKIGPCAQCQYVLGVRSQEDLDKYKNELLKIYCK